MPLLLAVISDRGSGAVDTGSQRRFRNNPSLPDGRNEVVFADHVLAVADQVLKQVKDLRGDGDEVTVATQLAPIRVERAIRK